ncbi:hypothetical protein Pcinc_013674 [Petrolisthes cinctipes]|uniref:Uncharacterized protein n=1 Tax=Petrolisthes cinctipes TaxID=88211 RepID=A0AAE1FWZ5_PETCI|nr:hypothetical protein Pcinc_013674 [Petrolisthes cinctipes]
MCVHVHQPFINCFQSRTNSYVLNFPRTQYHSLFSVLHSSSPVSPYVMVHVVSCPSLLLRSNEDGVDRQVTAEPPPFVDSEAEVENASQALSSTPPPTTVRPSPTPFSSGHGLRERLRERSRNNKIKDKKRRHRGHSSSSSPLRKKSRSSTPLVLRDVVAALSTQIQGLVSSLLDKLSRMIEARLPDRSRQLSPTSSLHSDLQVTMKEVGDHTQELGFLEVHPPPEPLGHKRDATFPVCPAMTLIPSPVRDHWHTH